MDFIQTRVTTAPVINNTGIFTVSDNGRNLTVNTTMVTEASSVAFYYVPSVRMAGEEVVMAETFIFSEFCLLVCS